MTTAQSHIDYLKEQITAKETEVSGKENQVELLKEGIKTDKAILKILKAGLEKMEGQAAKPVAHDGNS
jgi:hypothetical protein